MKKPAVFVLDSDVFITAKNAYYAFDICPGFWASLLQAHGDDRVCSIDGVKRELLAGQPKEDLVQWVKSQVPSSFFHPSQSKAIVEAYSDIMLWVQRNTQFYDQAKAKFATGADGWLVAYSMVHGTTVVTNEQPSPTARNQVKLPDVCTQFKVPFRDTYTMLRTLTIRLDLRKK